MRKKIILIILGLLVIIQFIRPTRNISTADSPNEISKHYTVPDEVKKILDVSCNDCHTNNTEYPWYTNVQPVGWWMQWHVNDGKKHLNFSEFASYTPKRQHKKLEETAEEVKEGEMPLNSYLWIHTDAKLSQDQKDLLINWASQLKDSVAKKYNLPPEEEKEAH
jgi:hypothetical protein